MHHENHGNCKGNELCDGECPPHQFHSSGLCQKKCHRKQNHQLSGHRDVHTVDGFSKCLERTSCCHAKACQNKAQADNPKCRNSTIPATAPPTTIPTACAVPTIPAALTGVPTTTIPAAYAVPTIPAASTIPATAAVQTTCAVPTNPAALTGVPTTTIPTACAISTNPATTTTQATAPPTTPTAGR